MSHAPDPVPTQPANAFTGFSPVKAATRLARLTFISGPRLLLTSRLSAKSAALMIMLCAPALLLTAMLTVPAMLFQSPQQHAYFYFAKILQQNPIHWPMLALVAACTVVALAVPATEARPFTAVR